MLSDLTAKYPADRLLTLKLDVSKPQEIVDAFAAAKDKFGRIDVVVNNAGGGMPCILEEGGCVVTSARRPVLNLKGCETDPTQSEKCST